MVTARMKKTKISETTPRVSYDSNLKVFNKLFITMIKISSTMKKTSSRDLRILKYLVVLRVANVLTAKWNPLVSINKNACAKGECHSKITTSACHHRSPNLNIL